MLSLAALALIGVTQPGPIETIKRFVHAMDIGDNATLADLTIGGNKANLHRFPMRWNGECRTPSVRFLGDSAIVTAKFYMKGRVPPSITWQMVTLRRVGGQWKVLPQGSYGYVTDVAKAARMAAGEPTIPSNLPFKGTERLQRAKELTYRCESYAINNGDILDSTEPQTRAVVNSLSALDPHVGYSINAQIVGKKLESTKAPGITIMVYEGSHGKLDFSHGGKAAVGFVDGHVELVSRNDLKSLLWNI